MSSPDYEQAIRELAEARAEIERLKAQLSASYGVTEVWQREALASQTERERAEARLAEALVSLRTSVEGGRLVLADLAAERAAHATTKAEIERLKASTQFQQWVSETSLRLKAEAAIERIRARWPHKRWDWRGRDGDPGAPECLACAIEECLREPRT